MEIMIDLETLGTRPDCPVISIGAISFDKTGIKDRLYVCIDMAEQLDSGKRKASAATIKWWMEQDGAARKVFKEEAVSVKIALERLSNFVKPLPFTPDCNPWGNGSVFDISILESLYNDYKMEIPWKFYNIMDLRTFQRFVANGEKVERSSGHHNALIDAEEQALFVIKWMNGGMLPKQSSLKQEPQTILRNEKDDESW